MVGQGGGTGPEKTRNTAGARQGEIKEKEKEYSAPIRMQGTQWGALTALRSKFIFPWLAIVGIYDFIKFVFVFSNFLCV